MHLYYKIMKNKTKQKHNWRKFMRFVKWYMKAGGHPLTPEQIERILIKF